MRTTILGVLMLAAPVAGLATSFADDIQPLLNNRCVACHMTGMEEGSLALVPGQAHAALVNAASVQADLPRVAPGEPERSYLLHKLAGTHLDHGGMGARMPMGGAPLAPEDLELLKAWIRQGAADN